MYNFRSAEKAHQVRCVELSFPPGDRRIQTFVYSGPRLVILVAQNQRVVSRLPFLPLLLGHRLEKFTRFGRCGFHQAPEPIQIDRAPSLVFHFHDSSVLPPHDTPLPAPVSV